MRQFRLIESKDEIEKLQHKLSTTIQRDFNQKEIRHIGYRGGSRKDREVFTNGKYWFLTPPFALKDIRNPRHLNWFGLLTDGKSLEITVEINVPLEGRNGLIGGILARDDSTGVVYLMHSGGLRGGAKGVGKWRFLSWLNEPLIEVIDSSGKTTKGILVMPIEGIGATKSLRRYIYKVSKFKEYVRSGKTGEQNFVDRERAFKEFYSEAKGRRQGVRSREIDYLSRHGEVVDALRDWRGGRLVKDVLMDMGVEDDKGNLVEVYEVKTDTTRSYIYGAIGQLMVHGDSDRCRKVLVIPQGKIPDDIERALKRINIKVIRFTLDEEGVTIID